MNVYVLCATRRGESFLNRLFQLCPEDHVSVFSFRETPWEPDYFDRIRTLADSHKARFFEATNVAHPKLNSLWQSAEPDLIFVVSWRYLIPMTIAQRAKLGCIVFHDSLLPAYRGFAPTNWAIINGESQTGATMFHLVEEMDAGDIIDQIAIPIGPDNTINAVMDKVTQAYLTLLEQNLALLKENKAPQRKQNHSRATYTCKRTPEDGEIDWSRSAHDIYNLIRASTHPYTGAFTWLNGQKMAVWSARRLGNYRNYIGAIPGAIAEIRKGEGAVVMAGEGELLLENVQLEGQEPVEASQVVNKLSIRLGARK